MKIKKNMKKLLYILTTIFLLQSCSEIENANVSNVLESKIDSIVSKPQMRTLADDTALVFFRYGQSNQAGFVSDANLQTPYLTFDSNIVFYNGTSFLPMDKNHNGYPTEDATFAAEFSFAWKVKAATNRKVYIIKHAVGSTSLYVNWKVGATLFNNSKTTLTNALALITTPYKLYVLYNQGENDANNSTYATAYKNYYIAQINNLYTNYNISGYICTKTDYNLGSSYDQRVKVRQAQVDAINSYSNSERVFIETRPLKVKLYSLISSATTTTVTDTSQSWTNNQWAGYWLNLTITDPPKRLAILSNTATTLTFASYGSTPSGTYEIVRGNLHYDATEIDSLGSYEFRKFMEIY